MARYFKEDPGFTCVNRSVIFIIYISYGVDKYAFKDSENFYFYNFIFVSYTRTTWAGEMSLKTFPRLEMEAENLGEESPEEETAPIKENETKSTYQLFPG